MSKEFTERGKVKTVQTDITHKNLKEAVEVISSNAEEMVIILKTDKDKPEYFWHEDLNGIEYVNSDNKAGYIHQKTGIERNQIILPIVQPVLKKVTANIGSKAIAKVEKELYDIVVNANR